MSNMPSLPVRRRSPAVAALLATVLGCVGGQTGEITTLSECDRLVARETIAELPPPEGDRVMAAHGSQELAVVWSEDGSTSTASIRVAIVGTSADRLGPAGCAPVLRVPIELEVVTADGLLAVQAGGFVDVSGETTTVHAAASLPSLDGGAPLPAPVDFSFWLERTPAGVVGEISVDGEPILRI